MKKAITLFAAFAMTAAVAMAQNPVNTFPWTEGFESGSATGFTFVDADGDGNNWAVHTNTGTGGLTTHNGESCVYSASWTQTQQALTPDNWMILPAMAIPADAEGFNLSWWAVGQDASYAAEHYSVYINTTGSEVSDFTATTAVYDGVSTENYTKLLVSLESYAGQTIYIAFRHHNITDMFYLNIDDIRVGGVEAPEVSVEGPAVAEINTSCTFTASGATAFTWTVDGTAQTETGATLTYSFTTAGNHTVVASATNAAGSGSDSIVVNVYDCSAAITAMPWNEGFEGNTDCWRFVVADTTSNGFSVYDQQGHNQSAFCLIGSYSDDSDVDQWAISPMITLPADAENYILKFYAYTNEYEGIQSHYEVRLTTESDPDTSDFTVLLEETSATGTYAPRTIALGEYAGQTIRIAFHNITAMGGDAMLVDDIYIGVPVAPDMAVTGPASAIMNEASEWQAITDADSVVWKVDGTVVSETGLTLSHTFATAGTHTIEATATNNAGSTSASVSVEVYDCSRIAEAPYMFDLATEYSPCWNNPEGGWDTINMGGSYALYSMSNLYGIFDLNPDNWIYTPTINVPAEGSYDVTWMVMPYAAQLPSDHYGVYVVKDGNATLLYEETLTANITEPRRRVATIPAELAGDVKIAFRHFETTGGYVILVSEIGVAATGTYVGIDNVENGTVAVYPNPASDKLVVEAENVSKVQVIDINGRVVFEAERAGSIDVSNLEAGVYMVRVICANGVSTTKIVKE